MLAFAAPAMADGTGRIAWTLRVNRHGTIVRTVRFQYSEPLDAARFALFQQRGSWEVEFTDHTSGTPRLCDPFPLCTDVEPGTRQTYPLFKNLLAKSPIRTTSRRTFTLHGSMTIGRRDSIDAVYATYRLCDAGCTSPSYFRRLVLPIEVQAGDKVTFAIAVSDTLTHG